MTTYLNIFLAVFAGLFPVVNPLGGAPIFYEMMRGAPDKVRAQVATKVALYGFILLVASMAVGSHVLTFFGISMPVLRVAGGLVVTVVGWQLLHQGEATTDRATASTTAVDPTAFVDKAFYPLTMPLTVGPGSIATAIALGTQGVDTSGESWAGLGLHVLAALAGLMAIGASIFVAYRYAGDIERILGRNGTNILVRLFAFILLCIGLQIMWTGIAQLIDSLAHP